MIEQVLQSSHDPDKLSLTVKGLLLGFVPFVMFVARTYGVEGIDANYVTAVIDQIGIIVQQLTALISTVLVLWGLLRKPFAQFKVQ